MNTKQTLLAFGLAFTLSQAMAIEASNESDVISIKPLQSFEGKGLSEHILPHDLQLLEDVVKGTTQQQAASQVTLNRQDFIKHLSKTYFLNLLEKPENQHIHNAMPAHEDNTLEGIAKAIGNWFASAKVGVSKQALLAEQEAEDFFHKILEGVKEVKAHITDKLSSKPEGDK